MKKSFSVILLFGLAVSALAAESPSFVKPTLVPSPRSATYELDKTFALTEDFPVAVACPEEGAADWVASHAKIWFGVTPRVTASGESSVDEDEGFELAVGADGVRISAKRLIGVKYAFYAFRQMAVPCRGVAKTTGWEAPYAKIADAPKMKWRGFHFCGTTKFSLEEIEHFLRMAAYYRYNYFVLEDHGGFKYEKTPWYSFPDAKITMDEIRRLKTVADDIGIALVPAINCYGHSAKAFEGGYVHVALDKHPELQPLFEPDYGWNWCVTNPETRKVVKGLLSELIEAFGNPQYVHLGFDEAHPPSCRDCATGEWYKHVADYLGDLAGFLRERGATAMVWHDQFLVKDDPRWKGFIHEGGKDAEKLLAAIPKDVIICDWYYGDGKDDYPTLTYFREQGFRTFTSPWGAVSSWASQYKGGGFTQVAWANDRGFDGALTTTWGACDREDRDREFLTADFMWGYPFKAATNYLYKCDNDWRWTHRYVATHWRQIGWDQSREVFPQASRAEPPTEVVVAAANARDFEKRAATFVCTGTNDERVINSAIALLSRGGTLRLADGDYSIDSFDNEGNSAVFFGYNNGDARVVTVTGTTENKGYNTRHGVTLHVTKAAMDAMKEDETYRVFFGASQKPKAAGDFFTYTHVNNVNFRSFFVFFDNASKNLIGIDGRNFGSMELDLIGIYQKSYFNDRFMHVGAPSIPCSGTVGVWSVPGSNDEMARGRYNEVNVGGLYRGFVMDGVDHLVMTGCAACRCVYGYWFEQGTPKTTTLINCCDEGNTYLPCFRDKGHVTMIDFNVERFNADFIPVDCKGPSVEYGATEDAPGGWHGFISYTLQGRAFGLGSGNFKSGRFWREGDGKNVKTVDLNEDVK